MHTHLHTETGFVASKAAPQRHYISTSTLYGLANGPLLKVHIRDVK